MQGVYPVSRQRAWQLRQEDKGLCKTCASPRNLSISLCDKCLEKQRIRQQVKKPRLKTILAEVE